MALRSSPPVMVRLQFQFVNPASANELRGSSKVGVNIVVVDARGPSILEYLMKRNLSPSQRALFTVFQSIRAEFRPPVRLATLPRIDYGCMAGG